MTTRPRPSMAYTAPSPMPTRSTWRKLVMCAPRFVTISSSSMGPSHSEVGVLDGGVGLELAGRALRDDLTGLEDVAPGGEVEREVGVLLDEQDGGAGLDRDLAQALEDPLGHQRRQPERRLVEQQQTRPGHERPCD